MATGNRFMVFIVLCLGLLLACANDRKTRVRVLHSAKATFLFVRRASPSPSPVIAAGSDSMAATPQGSQRFPRTKHIMLHMAPTGTTSYDDRDQHLARPLLEHGIASIIIMPPFYGSRAPASQPEHYIDNVAVSAAFYSL